jgi:hypothetical protein
MIAEATPRTAIRNAPVTPRPRKKAGIHFELPENDFRERINSNKGKKKGVETSE